MSNTKLAAKRTLTDSPDRHYGKVEDLTNLAWATDNNEVYFCPYCESLRGKPDTKGKFYYNVLKQVGHCFLCDSVIVGDELLSLQQISRVLIENDRDVEDRYKNQLLYIDQWSVPIKQNNECMAYMTGRGIRPDTLEHFKVRATSSPYDGVVLINRLIEDAIQIHTDYYQLRSISPAESHLRYTMVKNLLKPLSWLDQREDSEHVVLVEGFISGMSAYQHSDKTISPLVLSGKTISELQLNMLSSNLAERKTKTVYIALDGGWNLEAYRLAKRIYPSIPAESIKIVRLPNRQDPNEVSAECFNNALDTALEYTPFSEAAIRKELFGFD